MERKSEKSRAEKVDNMKWVNLEKFEEDELIQTGGDNLELLKGHIIEEYQSLENQIVDFLEIESQEIPNKSWRKINSLFLYLQKQNFVNKNKISFMNKKFNLLRKIRNCMGHGNFFNDFEGKCYSIFEDVEVKDKDNKSVALFITNKTQKEFDELVFKCWNFLGKILENSERFQQKMSEEDLE